MGSGQEGGKHTLFSSGGFWPWSPSGCWGGQGSSMAQHSTVGWVRGLEAVRGEMYHLQRIQRRAGSQKVAQILAGVNGDQESSENVAEIAGLLAGWMGTLNASGFLT